MPSQKPRTLTKDDSHALSTLLVQQSSDDARFFHPFPFTSEDLLEILSGVKEDLYIGIFEKEALIAFFMLRGWDEGYQIPAYGVYVDPQERGRGIGRFTLACALDLARTRGSKRVMLKVHPENTVAIHLYESCGFVYDHDEITTGNKVYYRNL